MNTKYYSNCGTETIDAALPDGIPLLIFDPGCGVSNACHKTLVASGITVHLLQPGHLGGFGQPEQHGWDLLADLPLIDGALIKKAKTVADALIPSHTASDLLAREIFEHVLLFTVDTGWFRDFAEMCNWLASGFLRNLILFWHSVHQDHPEILYLAALPGNDTEWKAAEAVLTKRLCILQSPVVAMRFCRPGFLLSSLRTEPRQVVFLAPGMRDLMDSEMMALYQFLFRIMSNLAELNGTPFHRLVPECEQELVMQSEC